MSDPLDVIAINRTSKYSLLSDGTQVQWQEMYDKYGEQTDSVEEATSVIFPLPNGEFGVLDLTKWETVTIH